MAFVAAPTPAVTVGTGTGQGAGRMLVSQTIGTPPQNAPFTRQPSWVRAPNNLSNTSVGTAI